MAINNLELWVQLHGMGTRFMSQRVVTDVKNYIGKFVESDENNFVGVLREFLRVSVYILLDKPLKRRMKLKKSDSNWCWVYFKYEGVPTFCFICGLIGHSDKFCEKLFDMVEEKIEKPFGSWMRAEPRRKMHTMGNRWLRPSGVAPMKDTVEETINMESSETTNVITMYEKSGSLLSNNVQKKGRLGGENLGENLARNVICSKLLPDNQGTVSIQEKTDKEVDQYELVITDPKRRRVGEEHGPTKIDNPDLEMSVSPQEDENSNQKNLYLAGAALQTRHSS